MSDEPTLPPVPNTPRKALAWLWDWGHVHTFLAGCAVGAAFVLVLRIL